ncbi:MAG: YdcF family protein, partial [Acidobacteria bacterium]|nr:YdcF family protein [Acidobacteriota bacterium]
MLTGRDIVCISSVDWDFHWQIHHELMSTLAARGNRVLFIENTGVRAPGVSDMTRIRQRIKNWWHSTKGFRLERENLFVYSPLFLPFPYSRIAGWLNRHVLFRPLRRWMAATGFHQPIVWTFLPTPTARDLIREVDPSLTIYYCADDFSASSHAARRIKRSEAQLFADVDLVFATSQKLLDRARQYTTRARRFPAGVNYDKFTAVNAAADAMPADLQALHPPIAGYVGALHVWLDQDLIVDLARRMPDVTFALVGPTHSDTSRLTACPNVHLLGGRPHDEVPHYIKGFNVGLVPYRVSEYTASVYPVKLNEYLAMGVPVVSSDLPEVRRFNADHGGVLAIASDTAQFEQAVRSALTPAAPAEIERRRSVARENSWTSRIDAMSALVTGALAERARTRDGWDERLRRAYRLARRRALEAVLALVFAYGILFETPAVWLMAAPLKVEAPPQHADAIVVFAGGVGESGQAGGGYQERVKQAVDLYRQGFAPRIVISSGFVFAFKEAEVMRALAVASGVPDSAIVLETRAANTFENVTFTREILDRNGWRRILLVSSPYHMRRALLTWKKAAPSKAFFTSSSGGPKQNTSSCQAISALMAPTHGAPRSASAR